MEKTQKTIEKYMKVRGWHDSLPANIAKSIMIEGAELLEHFQWSNLTVAQTKKDKEKMVEIRKELADVFIYCFTMAISLGIDAEKAVIEKLEAAKEKYPTKKIKLGQGEYLKIKQEYRKGKK